jgi:hypothetical protein
MPFAGSNEHSNDPPGFIQHGTNTVFPALNYTMKAYISRNILDLDTSWK